MFCMSCTLNTSVAVQVSTAQSLGVRNVHETTHETFSDNCINRFSVLLTTSGSLSEGVQANSEGIIVQSHGHGHMMDTHHWGHHLEFGIEGLGLGSFKMHQK